MHKTISLTQRIKQRRAGVNTNINSKIKQLQQKLVRLSFSNDKNRSTQYQTTLDEIEQLRGQIFNKGMDNE